MSADRILPTLDAFQDLLDRHGSHLDTWPADRRAEAEALCRQDAAARRLLDEAAGLATLLDHSRVAPPDGDLTARILATAPTWPLRRAEPRRGFWQALVEGLGLDTLGSGLRPAMALASALVLGLSLGLATEIGFGSTSDSVIAADTIDGYAFGFLGATDDAASSADQPT
ncbi:MAG: hypothetical protein KDA49_02020 [Rhodospirillaceae bacterium]|nr:hypothetical protein [Rhodospirillaceae bacterium]